MSCRAMRMALLMSAFALMPAALQAQPAADVAASEQVAALVSSNSALDVPIEEIAASLSGCAILDKDFPGLRTHAMYVFFKVMTLNQIAALSDGRITPNMLAQARTDLSALPFKFLAQNVHQTDIDDLDLVPPLRQASLSDSHPK
ncbi:MAG: hypothetical protein WCA81_10470 [Rhizomicrobium sp.]